MVALLKSPEKCAYIADLLKALGHPVRLQIVALLCNEDLHVGALEARMGLPQSTVSQQLGVLRARGLVATRREAGRAVYRLAEPQLRNLVSCMEGCNARR